MKRLQITFWSMKRLVIFAALPVVSFESRVGPVQVACRANSQLRWAAGALIKLLEM